MSETLSAAIATQGLSKCYGDSTVVRSLNLEVPQGCIYGLLGRNGAGKSTTIRMLTGMVRPTFGTATMLGESIMEMTPETRGRIAYVAEGHPLYRLWTIQQLERFNRSFYPFWNVELFEQLLDHFELSRKKRVWSLSRGQRAQVALALAIAPDPELLILDDPTLGLDTVVRRELLESLIQLIQREGRTILFSSHILGDVERIADRIGIMLDGVLRVDCPLDHFRDSVRRLVMTFAGEVSEFPMTAGVVSSHTVENRRELVIAGYSDAHRQAAESLNPKSIEVVTLNLEDAFIAYSRGNRRSLPVFSTSNRPRQPTEVLS